MRRRVALAASALVILIVLPLCLLTAEDTAVIGRWETTVETAGLTLEVDFTFGGDGIYTCALRADFAGESQAVSTQGQYKAKGGKLFLSQGLDYQIDPKVYDVYAIQDDILTIQGGSGAGLDQLFPLKLKRVET